MSPIGGLCASGRAADIVLGAMALEALLLVAAGRPPRAVVQALLPGMLLVIGLRAALVGAAWPFVAVPVTLSLPAHLLYLRGRGWLGTNRAPHDLKRHASRLPRRGIWARLY